LLVVAPRAAFQPWEDEFEECFGTAPQSVRLTGSPGERQRFYLEPGTAELFLITYQMAANDVDQLRGLCRRESMMLVLDESHYVKRFEEGRWANAVLELAPFAERRLVLSGTPMPQGCEDLWTQFTFLWPGRQVLGERAQFRRECESGDLSSVKEKVAPFFRRITKSDLDLPELVVERIRVQMAPQQDRIYSAIAEKVLADSAFEPSDRQAIRYWRRARMVRLLQAASNPSLLGEYSEEFDLNSSDANESRIVELAKRYHEYEIPAKFQVASALTEHLVASGRKVVVWTTFVRNISMFRSLVKELAPSFIVYGAVPKDYSEDEEFNREQQIEGFKGVSGPAILIANPAACGESISLHHASTDALYIDRSFDCAKYLQSQDRVHRLGLPKDARVHIRLLLASETIDEVVDNRLGEKAERMMRLLGDDFPIGQPEDIDDNDLEQEEDYTATLASVRARLSAD
jgi:SNF2 family DNA or RNA helicase